MPINSNDPLFNGLVYRSRINDIMNMSDSNAIGSFTIAELDTQYNDIVDLDAIESRTFDADSDGIVRGFTDFSNTINTMDENHWLQVDSDGYGNNMLGYQLDFESEQPGRRQPPIYSIGVSNLQAQRSTVSSIVENVINASGTLEAQVVIVNGVAEDKHTGTGEIEAQASTVVATSERIINVDTSLEAQASTVDGLAVDKHIGSGTLEAQVSTVDGLSENIITGSGTLESQSSTASGLSDLENIASGTLEAQASTVDGAGSITPAIIGSGTLLAQVSTVVGTPTETATASGTLEAQVADVDGAGSIRPAITGSGTLLAQVADADGAASVTPAITGSGTLLAQVADVDGDGNTIEPYVGMPFPQIYVGMPFPEIYVDGVVQGTSPAHTASGTLLSSNSEVDGLQPVMLGTYYYDNLLGNDVTGDGSAATPWASIDKVIEDGLVPGYVTIGIDNGPQNPYRAQSSSSVAYLNDKYGTALNPIALKGDPNSTAYLSEYPDRPTTQYPNTYITQATETTGWVASSTYTGVWEVTNPFPSTVITKTALFSCSASEWTANGVMGILRASKLEWRVSTNNPNDLLGGEWWGDSSKLYYKPQPGEVLSTHHFEYADSLSVFNMKRITHMTFEGLAFVCSSGTAVTSGGRGVNWEANGTGTPLVDDWCSYVTVKDCYIKYFKNGIIFNAGEYYFIDNCIATDNMNNGFGFLGSKGDFPATPSTNRGFPCSNTLLQNSTVGRCFANDGIVYHKDNPYTDPNNTGSPNNSRQDDIGANHKVVNCISFDNAENGFDITSGSFITVIGCTSHDNGNAGITFGHYVRHVTVINHISYNDDYDRTAGGSFSVGDSRNVTVDNATSYNPGQRFLQVKADAQNALIKNSRFVAGPDTDNSEAIAVVQGSSTEYTTVPRNGSTYTTQTPTSFTPDPYATGSNAPQRPRNLVFENNVFEIAFGGITSNASKNYKFKFFFSIEILPIQGYEYSFSGNEWKTSVLNTQWQPNTAADLPASDYGPYKIKNSFLAQTTGGQPVIDVVANQTYIAAGNFPTESDLWNFWPTGVTPVGREISNDTTGVLTGVYNTSSGFSTNDSQSDLGLYSSANNISGQSTYWDPISVIGINNDPSYEYWTQTNWTIVSPSATGTSRAVGYKDSGIVNVTAQAPWSGDQRVSAGPMVCMNATTTEFGLAFVWYAGAAGNASYLALFEVGQQDTDLNLVGISAPYPHTDGIELKLQMKVTNGLLRCYAGTRPLPDTLVTSTNQYSGTLIPLTTTEGGTTFSNTYDIATNNSNLNNSTIHGVYLINNETAGSRTSSLQYVRYPDLLMDLG